MKMRGGEKQDRYIQDAHLVSAYVKVTNIATLVKMMSRNTEIRDFDCGLCSD